MLREAAEAEALKREKHKPRTLSHKHWQAAHSSTKGWHVALVDCPLHAATVAREAAKTALRSGNMGNFIELAGEALMARVRAELANVPASVDERPEGQDPQGLEAKPASAVPCADTADAQPSPGDSN